MWTGAINMIVFHELQGSTTARSVLHKALGSQCNASGNGLRKPALKSDDNPPERNAAWIYHGFQSKQRCQVLVARKTVNGAAGIATVSIKTVSIKTDDADDDPPNSWPRPHVYRGWAFAYNFTATGTPTKKDPKASGATVSSTLAAWECGSVLAFRMRSDPNIPLSLQNRQITVTDSTLSNIGGCRF